jgi:hypothetical protein
MTIQKMDISSPPPSGPTANERPRRVSKPPDRYEPVEKVEDDYDAEDYDSNDPTDVSDGIETGSDEEDDESDADEYGNLDGFVVPDKSESDDETTDGESSVSTKKRVPPTPRRGRAPPTPVPVGTPPTRRSARRRLP